MISQIPATFQLTQAQELLLQAIFPFQPGAWDRNDVEPIKQEIHAQLLAIQNGNCCYCGLKVNEGGRAEIDHIAKKGGPRRPAYTEFIFTPKNLVIACQYCNSSSKKGQDDVLDQVDLTNYDNCTFKIVHPYNDDPTHHYSWSTGRFKILISAVSNKGRYSISLFELDSEAHTFARAKQVMFETRLARYNNRQAIKQRVLDILKFNF
ncbi:HNH endonuclease family protein [Ohtaekwangia koreensis]|uniref:TIGR02646 family protein n=1 Tax=Ohtaekwangia koreensis TaxID=688867 RepID=A0A1T5M9W4_9BACT|nr:hypothetical protein [Ohtaekwangia koreensis]SKC85036.1 TIGR02646 family protein [Ohtaekwangia koreensis]